MNISPKRIILTSFLVDLIDIATNVVVAILTGSVVMAAETLQGAADLTAVGFLLIGLIRSNRPADRVHPFGYGREIYFWTLLSSLLMLALTASLSFYLGLQRFLNPTEIKDTYLALIVLAIAVSTNGYAVSLDIRRLNNGDSIFNTLRNFLRSSYIETKTTFVLDLMGTCAAVFGFISLSLYKLTGNLQFDGIGAILIGVILAAFSILLILGVKDLLIGKTAPKEVEKEIKAITLSYSEVREIVELKTIHSGEHIIVNLDLHLKNDLKTDQIEKLTEKIKSKIKSTIPSIFEVQVELKS